VEIHGIVARLKEWVAENGRVPTRSEFAHQFPGLNYALGSGKFTWTTLLHAAGLPSYRERKERGEMSAKLTNEIFSRPIEEAIAEFKPREIAEHTLPIQPILCIPDTHFPFTSQKVLEGIYRFAEKEKPSLVVQLGDLFDLYCHAKFPKSMNIYKPQEEEELARKGAETMWKELQKAAPKAKCVQLKGNHDIRPLKRTLEGQPQLEHVVARHFDKLMTFDNVELISDYRQEFIVGDIEFIHGYKSGIGGHRDHALMNAVCGHIHVGGVSYRRIRGRTLWELNCGMAGEPESKAFSYTPQKISNWTPGFGFIDEHGPRFIPVG